MPVASPEVTIYADGAASPNPGPGGYGVIVIRDGHRLELSGGFRKTTNIGVGRGGRSIFGCWVQAMTGLPPVRPCPFI